MNQPEIVHTRAISVHQPWASLIAGGFKTLETRTWIPPFIGEIAIHAVAAIPNYAWEMVANNRMFTEALQAMGHDGTMQDLPLGAVIALATIEAAGVVDHLSMDHNFSGTLYWRDYRLQESQRRVTRLSPRELAFGDFAVGRSIWELRDVRPLPIPIPARGRQGIWNWEHRETGLEKFS